MNENFLSGNAILQEIREDNQEAFNKLFRYYYPRLLAYVSSVMDDEIAEDITQDVFLYVWENRKKLYIGGGFQSYLFQSAYTRCLDFIRKKNNMAKYTVHMELAEQHRFLQENGCTEIERLYTQDFHQTLNDLLNELPEQRREIFKLSYLKGMKTKDISEKLGVPQRTVESHIYLTLKFLRNRMSKEDFFILCVFFNFN